MNEHRYDMSQLEQEEAIIEAEDFAQEKLNKLTDEFYLEWYNSENDFDLYITELPTENPSLLKELYLQIHAGDVPALKNLAEGYQAWCRERALEEATARLYANVFGED